jgi:colanic acid biosynthesis glycosyl transferase WcaI
VVLAAADVLVVNEPPSVGVMSLPSKLTRNLAARRPILAAVVQGGASDCELLSTGGAAWTLPPGDPVLLAAALTALARDDLRREAMAVAAAGHAARTLGREGSLSALVALLLRTQDGALG